MELFSKAVDHVVRQFSPPSSGYQSGDLISVVRADESDKLVLMRLVIKTNHNRWFRNWTQYRPTDFTLSDIILQGKLPLKPGVDEKVLGQFKGTYRYNHSGKLVATVVLKCTGRGSAEAELKLNPVTIKKETVNVKKLRESKNRLECDMQNELVQQMQEAKKAPKCPHVLALLTERVVTTSSWDIRENWKRTGGAEVGGTDTVDASLEVTKDESITIPAGTVIAYGLRKLNIKDGYLVFPEPALQLDCAGDIEQDSISDEDLVSTELQNLGKHLPPLAELPQSTRSALFQRFCEVMKDRDALLGVEITLEEWCTGIAPVVTEQNASVSHSNSASAILELLKPDPDSHMEWLGCPGTPGGPLTAAHLLVSAMEELPDEALSLVRECSPDVLKAFNALLIMLDLKNQKKSCSPLPLESLPLPLQDDKAFHWVQQLLITSNVDLRREAGGLLAERESDAGVLPLVLCVTVQGLCYLL